MEKKLDRFFNLRINSRSASFENINIGPNLSLYMKRDKIQEFCKAFNELTEIYKFEDLEIYVRLFLFTDRSFIFLVKGPSFSTLIKIAVNIAHFDNINKKNISFKNYFDIFWLRNYYWLKFYKNLDQVWLKLRFKNSFYSLLNINFFFFNNKE